MQILPDEKHPLFLTTNRIPAPMTKAIDTQRALAKNYLQLLGKSYYCFSSISILSFIANGNKRKH